MTLRARFGLLGHDRQTHLPGTDPAALPAPEGTAMVKDIHAGPAGGGPYGFAPLGDGRALFGANDGVSGTELWVTDGTAASTALLKDVEPGYGSGFAFDASTPVVGGASWLDAAG